MLAKRARLAQWLTGRGIEIGALHHPLEVPSGAQVTYVDHLPEDGLREHYPELADLPLAPVSVICSADDLRPFEDASLDFVIANHLLEHLEYPARALLEFARVLKPGGIVYLALPDKRSTFDRDRELTTVAHLIEEHQSGSAAFNRRAHYLDWVEHVGEKLTGAEVEQRANELLARNYSIHFHVWRPGTFVDFLSAARGFLGLQLELLEFAAAEAPGDTEFVLLLGKPGPGDPILPPQGPAEPAIAPPPAPSAMRRLRAMVGRTPLGPPLRAARHRLAGARPKP